VIAIVVALGPLDGGIVAVLGITSAQYVGASAVYALLLLGRHWGVTLNFDRGLATEMLRYGARVYFAALMSFMVIRSDMFLVNGYMGSGEAGLYAVAVALGEGIYLLPTIIGLNLFPRVASGAGAKASAEVFRIMLVLYGAMCAVAAALSPLVIRVLYGERFENATGLFLWLVPGIFFLGMLTILSNHFAGRGFPLEAALVWVVGIGVNITLNVLFLQDVGTWFASLSSSIAYALLFVLHVWMFKREVGSWGELVPRPAEVRAFLRVTLARLGPLRRRVSAA
jgi:O-antigen/teichoic acid export membrane protein